MTKYPQWRRGAGWTGNHANAMPAAQAIALRLENITERFTPGEADLLETMAVSNPGHVLVQCGTAKKPGLILCWDPAQSAILRRKMRLQFSSVRGNIGKSEKLSHLIKPVRAGANSK
jgi:hypothetical protein